MGPFLLSSLIGHSRSYLVMVCLLTDEVIYNFQSFTLQTKKKLIFSGDFDAS